MKALQGTDGVRGRVCLDNATRNTDSVMLFREHGLITPEFVVRYVSGFCRYLLANGFAKENDEIIAGWDPRDKEGYFSTAAIEAIRRNKLVPVIAGCFPTPGIALYMLYKNAAGAVVITASHNPADYNGIKLFLPGLCLKPYPVNDEMITDTVLGEDDTPAPEPDTALNNLKTDPAALRFYVQTLRNPENTWMQPEQPLRPGIQLVIDTAHGAMSNVVGDALNNLPGVLPVFVNDDLNSPVNTDGGVVTIEDAHTIYPKTIADPDSKYSGHEGIQAMVRLAAEIKKEQSIQHLCGISFDGDGDRFLFYHYDEHYSCIRVYNGDRISILLTHYLADRTNPRNIHFINTIEGSLPPVECARKKGIHHHLTGIGDKWIAWKAWNILFRMCGISGENMNLLARSQPDYTTLHDLLNRIRANQNSDLTQYILKLKNRNSMIFGSEPSGHLLTPVFIETQNGIDEMTFCGDGLKSLFNVLTVWSAETNKSPAITHDDAGKHIHEKRYCFYPDKEKMKKGSRFHENLKQIIKTSLQDTFSADFIIRPKQFNEEPDLIYYDVTDKNQMTTAGTLFVRNSGTEPKTGVHVQGREDYNHQWTSIMEQIHLFLLIHLKSAEHPLARAELQLLHMLDKAPVPVGKIPALIPGFPWDRMLNEIVHYEKLAVKKDTQLSISPTGKHLMQMLPVNERKSP